MDPREIAEQNLRERLADNPYPGRGLILGCDESGETLVQVYWIMGRSPNSRNRVFETDGAGLWTEAADPALLTDPRLVIYHAMRELRGLFIVTNGDQTDTIHKTLLHGGTFDQALATRAHEPDAPNYTPRISGLFDLRLGHPIATLCVLRRSPFADAADRLLWHYEAFAPGLGLCITTYMGDGSPLPPFQGEPFLLPLPGDARGIAEALWANLNEDNRVALCAKTIDPATLRSTLHVVNKYHKKPQ